MPPEWGVWDEGVEPDRNLHGHVLVDRVSSERLRQAFKHVNLDEIPGHDRQLAIEEAIQPNREPNEWQSDDDEPDDVVGHHSLEAVLVGLGQQDW